MKIINKILSKFNLRIMRIFPKPFQRVALKDKKNMVGVEIGVYSGKNALSLLKGSSIRKLYLIDPYEEYVNYADEELRKAEKEAKQRLKRFSDKIIFIKKKSEEAVDDIPDNLDFVYIDGNHTYKYVKKDIENYYPKLKKGGILAGHDFGFDMIYGKVDGVMEAVSKFVIKNNLKLYVCFEDWWLVKK